MLFQHVKATLLTVGIFTCTNLSCNAFSLTPTSLVSQSGLYAVKDVASLLDNTFVPPDTMAAGITDQACTDAASKMQRINVPGESGNTIIRNL